MQKKTEHQQRVEELMVNARQVIPDRPTMPDEKTRLLRAKLILEEALETVRDLGFDFVPFGEVRYAILDKGDFKASMFKANGKENLEGIADGCADVSVVTIGTLSACGIADDSLLREVDCNNLAKFEHRCPDCGQLHDDSMMTEKEKIVHVQPMTAHGDDVAKPGNRLCLCCGTIWQSGHHNKDGKWVKPSNHKPPRIADVLFAQNVEADQQIKREEGGACLGKNYGPGDPVCHACSSRSECVNKFLFCS